MHLHRKFFAGKKKLDQQRKAATAWRGLTHEVASKPACHRGQVLARKRTVSDAAFIAGEPDLAYGDLFRRPPVLVEWRQIARSPDALDKLWGQEEWIQLRHDDRRLLYFKSTQYTALSTQRADGSNSA